MIFTNKMFFKIFTLCIFLGFLNGCSNEVDGDVYFPLNEGLSWTYKVTTDYPGRKKESVLTITSLGEEDYADKSYYIRRTSSGIDYYINADEEGVYRSGLRTVVETGPRLDAEKRFILKKPYTVGTNWEEISRPLIFLQVFPYEKRTGDNAQVPISYVIDSLSETVTVPAGEFENCIKVVGKGVFEIYTDGVNGYSEIPLQVEEWYAPGVGLVKQVRRELDGEVIMHSDTPVFMGGNVKLELTAY